MRVAAKQVRSSMSIFAHFFIRTQPSKNIKTFAFLKTGCYVCRRICYPLSYPNRYGPLTRYLWLYFLREDSEGVFTLRNSGSNETMRFLFSYLCTSDGFTSIAIYIVNFGYLYHIIVKHRPFSCSFHLAAHSHYDTFPHQTDKSPTGNVATHGAPHDRGRLRCHQETDCNLFCWQTYQFG